MNALMNEMDARQEAIAGVDNFSSQMSQTAPESTLGMDFSIDSLVFAEGNDRKSRYIAG